MGKAITQDKLKVELIDFLINREDYLLKQSMVGINSLSSSAESGGWDGDKFKSAHCELMPKLFLVQIDEILVLLGEIWL